MYVTWWFLRFFDNFFSVSRSEALVREDAELSITVFCCYWSGLMSIWLELQPVYFALFGFHVFGLGFLTSMVRCRITLPWYTFQMAMMLLCRVCGNHMAALVQRIRVPFNDTLGPCPLLCRCSSS